MDPVSERLYTFTGVTPAHADDDRAREDGIRQPSQASQSHGAVCRQLFRLDDLTSDRLGLRCGVAASLKRRLGRTSREAGHSRVPAPLHMIRGIIRRLIGLCPL
jgi:hypothetical protein